MSRDTAKTITLLLNSVRLGDGSAVDQLWKLVYRELHGMAENQLRKEYDVHRLDPTELIHEAFLRLVPQGDGQFENRKHFFSAAAEAMRRIRVDDARMRSRAKRGGGVKAVQLFAEPSFTPQNHEEVLAIDEALNQLQQADAQKADVVKLRYFAGCSINETAEALGISARKVNLEWRFARTWLYRALSDGDGTGEPIEF